MIFVTLGSQKFQFDRLLKAVDRLIDEGTITEEVFAQAGYSRYAPRNYAYKEFLNHDEFDDRIANADLVLTHGGVGVIFGAISKGKKVVAVPRLAKYGEHVDNHQLEILGEFKEMGLIATCTDFDQLGEVLEMAKRTDFQPYKGNNKAITDDIARYIDSI